MVDEMPCEKCICLAICKGQDVNNLLFKCKILKTFMEKDLDHFDYGLEFFNYTMTEEDRIKIL